jgi:hypothetical protein
MTIENSHIEKDEYGSLWVYQDDRLQCEAFYRAEDESVADMLEAGYVLLPYEFEGEQVFVL